MKHLTIVRNAVVPAPPPAPIPEGIYLQVKSSWDAYGMSRATWNEKEAGMSLRAQVFGIPDPWRIRPREISGKPDYVELTADRQHWLMKINLEMQWGRAISKDEYFAWWNAPSSSGKSQMIDWMISAYNHYRCYTNIFGMTTHANHLTGERLGMENPRYFHLLTGRTILKPIMDTPYMPAIRNLAGDGNCYGFECIDARDDLWQYSPFTHRHLFEEPLSTGREIGYNKAGAYIVRDDLHKPFPQFGGRMITPLWLPQDKVAWISVSLARIVTAETIGTFNKRWLV